MNDDINFEWNLYHDMDNRNYNDVKQIEILKNWIKHHQKCVEITMDGLTKYRKQVESMTETKVKK